MSNYNSDNETTSCSRNIASTGNSAPSTAGDLAQAEHGPNSSSINTEHLETGDYIVSVFWSHGSLAIAYYEISTMELFVSAEVFDPKPDYPFLHNLFDQINMTDMICSGPIQFIKKVMELTDLPPADYENYYVRKHNPITSRSFVIYTNNLRTLATNRKRIFNLNMVGMKSDSTEHERKMFLESILPLHQEAVVQTLGNLLIYLDANWRHLFLMNDSNPIIVDCSVLAMDKQLLIDEWSILSLQIFSPTERHPSGFKRGAEQEVKEGLSLFAIFDRCASKIGRRQMKSILQQPSQDLAKLGDRQNVIEWCLPDENADRIRTLRVLLGKMVNVSEVFLRLAVSPLNTKYKDWWTLYECISSVHRMRTICQEIDYERDSLQPIELLKKLAIQDDEEFVQIEKVMIVLQRAFNVDESKIQNQFVVKAEFYDGLDRMKNALEALRIELGEMINVEVSRLPSEIDAVTFEFIVEFGFIFAFSNEKKIEQNRVITTFRECGFQFLYIVKQQFYFKSLALNEMNTQYTKQKANIRYEEQQIAESILSFIKPRIVQFQAYIGLCAKFDCLIAMASVATELHLVRPEITSENIIEIHDGRHILLEKMNGGTLTSTANDTLFLADQPNRITILTAPNAAGKSVYLKQIALIVYMAHIGSFVPATSATIGRFDGIFLRMYVPETMHNNSSSFLVELQQMSKILMNTSARSLVIIDEFGQGTTMNEGRAMLGAATMCLMDRGALAPITFISTHYLDLIDIIRPSELLCSKTIAMRRNAEHMIESTYKIIDGKCTVNYATECAELNSAMKLIFDDRHSDDEPLNSTTMDPQTDDENKEKKIQVAFDIFKMYLDNDRVVDEAVVDRMLSEVDITD